MAEIDIERKSRRGGWSWALLILVILAIAAAAWYFLAGPGMTVPEEAGEPGVETLETPAGTPLPSEDDPGR